MAAVEAPSKAAPNDDRRDVEVRLLDSFLRSVNCDVVLEVGTGRGQMTPAIHRWSDRYVGLDIDRTALLEARRAARWTGSTSWIVGNGTRLPLSDESCTAIVALRILHRFADPALFLRELRRILAPSGHLLLSVNPRPSWGLLAWDITRGLRGSRCGPPVTFSHTPDARIDSTSSPGYVTTRKRTDSTLRAQGFDVIRTAGAGFEQFRFLRTLPGTWYERWAPWAAHVPGTPVIFVLAQRRN